MKKQWKIKDQGTEDLVNLPEYPQLILRLLALRNLRAPEAIWDFLNPDYAKLHDPFLFKDMQKAVSRIREAIEKKQKIAIYADYDTDAITACAVLYLALKKLGAEPIYYIPDRFTEGYGTNLDAIKKLGQQGTNLIITVDCGINSVEEAELAKLLGMDFIITDHHELTGDLPQAFAVINPKNPHDEYPFSGLTGVGVAFKLVQALGLNGYEKWLLDLVAIGTVADCQNLVDENRILVSFGLKVLHKTRWMGIKAMLMSSGIKADKYDAFTLGFILAPRINAAGRIKHAEIAFKLLISDDPDEAEALAAQINDLNKHRQMLTDQILSEARGQVELIADKKVLIAYGLDWPKGVVGLVAGRLCEEYNRPVLVAATSPDGQAVGSARSVPDFDMVAALTFAKSHLQKYGGHTQAAGFTLRHEELGNFHLKLLEYAEVRNLQITDPVLSVDAEILPTDLTWENLEYIEKFGPFGFGNLKPKLMGRGFQVLECRLVGNNKHLKLKVGFGEHNVEAIAFSQGFLAGQMLPGQRFDAVFELGANEWNGNRSMQLKILDIKLNE